MRTLTKIFLIAISVCLIIPNQASAKKIEAIKGKNYFLTKKHGPWMIMVAVFSAPPEELKKEGMGPEQAAQSLVMELRGKGIPAYTFWRKQSVESVYTLNRYQEQVERQYELNSEICVLAGNYNSPESDKGLGKRTVEWIKKNNPECMRNDGVYILAAGKSGPLSGAFLTINPMLSPEDVSKMKRDPDLIRFNSHTQYSLLENPGKYSVIVASFYGKSVAELSGQSKGGFSKTLKKGNGLDLASGQSWQVMRDLRERGIEAYIFHDRKKSIVTVGSFNSKTDPGINKVIKKFSAQWKTDPTTGRPALLAELLVLPSKNGQWMCTFDPVPKLMEVPYKN